MRIVFNSYQKKELSLIYIVKYPDYLKIMIE